MIRTPVQDLYLRSSQLCLIKRIGAAYARAHAHTCPCAYANARTLVARESILGGGSSLQFRRGVSLWSRSARVRNVLGCGSFLIVSGRVLLSDVSSPPHKVPMPAGGHLHPPDAIRQRQAGERSRRGRARRSRADGTISGPAAGHRD